MKYGSNKLSLTNTTRGLIYFFAKEPKGRDLQKWGLLSTHGWNPMQSRYMLCVLTGSEKNKLFILLCNKIPP